MWIWYLFLHYFFNENFKCDFLKWKKVNFFVFVHSSGQRDKPFVRDDEYDVRTPRPDLFDKPYATDFAGETFRKVRSIKMWEKIKERVGN